MDKKEFFFSWLVLLALSLFGENAKEGRMVAMGKWEVGRFGRGALSET